MKKSGILFLILLSLPILVLAQRKIDLHIPNRVIVNFLDHVVYAEITEGKPLIKVSDEFFYHWYSANDIKKTRGGFEGKLLHGLYSDFYMNKNLREKGMFKYGRKDGLWKSWHINGELREVYHWKKGKLHGEFLVFDESGKLLQKGTYKDNLFNGKRYIYESSGDVKIEKYNKGELKTKKEKKGKGFRIKLWRKYKKKQTTVPAASPVPPANDQPQPNVLPGVENPPAEKQSRKSKRNKSEKNKTEKNKSSESPEKEKRKEKVRIRKVKKIVPGGTENKQI